jgi:hypothetical protein
MFESARNQLLEQYALLVDSISEENRTLLTDWLINIDGERLARMIYGIQVDLNRVLTMYDQAKPHELHVKTIKAYCRLLEIMFRRYFFEVT